MELCEARWNSRSIKIRVPPFGGPRFSPGWLVVVEEYWQDRRDTTATSRPLVNVTTFTVATGFMGMLRFAPFHALIDAPSTI
jgi:hypothetical protein